jgi:hypothetical protein
VARSQTLEPSHRYRVAQAVADVVKGRRRVPYGEAMRLATDACGPPRHVRGGGVTRAPRPSFSRGRWAGCVSRGVGDHAVLVPGGGVSMFDPAWREKRDRARGRP